MKDLVEACELLEEIESWADEDLEELPELYQVKAEKYRKLLQSNQI